MNLLWDCREKNENLHHHHKCMQIQKRTGCCRMRILIVLLEKQQPCSGKQNILEEQPQKEMILQCLKEFWHKPEFKLFLTIFKTKNLKNISTTLKACHLFCKCCRNFLLTIWDAVMEKISIWLRSSIQCELIMLGKVARKFFPTKTFHPQSGKKIIELMFFVLTQVEWGRTMTEQFAERISTWRNSV